MSPGGVGAPILLLEDERATAALVGQLLAAERITNPIESMDTGEAALDYLNLVVDGQAAMPVLCVLDLSLPDERVVAEKVAGLVPVRGNDEARDNRRAAVLLSRCITAARNDSRLKTKEMKDTVVQAYADKALKYLQTLVAKGQIEHRRLEHSVIPASVEQVFGLAPMTVRDSSIDGLQNLVTLATPRTDTPLTLTSDRVPAPVPHAGDNETPPALDPSRSLSSLSDASSNTALTCPSNSTGRTMTFLGVARNRPETIGTTVSGMSVSNMRRASAAH